MDAAQRDVTLLYFFMNNGHWPDAEAKARGFDVERETYQWLLLLQKQEQLGIKVSSETAAQFARQMLTPFFKGHPVSATEFVQQVLEPKGFRIEDFERFCRHYLGRQELINTVGMTGKLLTPQEGKELYVREFQELNTEAVFLGLEFTSPASRSRRKRFPSSTPTNSPTTASRSGFRSAM